MQGVAGAPASAATVAGSSRPAESVAAHRRKRTIYFNDARHYYLFVFEPPMTMQDAWRPVDEVAGTAVDTFIYGVERGDGLFYPSKVGMQFGADKRPFSMAAYWRTWENMQSLASRGLDPLQVLIDRAHDKGMEFFASVRMSSYGGMDAKLRVPEGRGLAHAEVRDHQFAVLEELVSDYDTEGVELDFAAAPGGMPLCLRPEDVAEYTPVLTDYVREISKMVRAVSGDGKQIGVRVYPTKEMCRERGLDIDTWIEEGLVDYVVPLLYLDFTLDPDMPIDWLIGKAHEYDIPVYGMLQPYVQDEATGSPVRIYATPEVARGVVANHWARGVDGIYAWFMRWPLDDSERRILTEVGDPDLIQEGSKRYVQRHRSEQASELGYDATLPLEIAEADPSKRYSIPFSIADDIDAAPKRVRQVVVELVVTNLVSADRLGIFLNGESLGAETCLRDFSWNIAPYQGQKLEFHLEQVRPVRGRNLLEVSLDGRPEGLAGGITIEGLEVRVEYGSYPSSLDVS
jgi:hypothetical protein